MILVNEMACLFELFKNQVWQLHSTILGVAIDFWNDFLHLLPREFSSKFEKWEATIGTDNPHQTRGAIRKTTILNNAKTIIFDLRSIKYRSETLVVS